MCQEMGRVKECEEKSYYARCSLIVATLSWYDFCASCSVGPDERNMLFVYPKCDVIFLKLQFVVQWNP